jgi:glycerol-3-phosphate dehydrogenase
MNSLAQELKFPLKWVGKYVIAKNDNEIKYLKNLKNQGIRNYVPSLELQDRKIISIKEPNINCIKALWVPTAGITLPYQFNIALAENSVKNGVNFFLETAVKNIKKHNNFFLIETNKGEFQSEIIINAAGLNCRNIVNMLEEPDFNIYPCKGEYLVLDKNFSSLINSMIYPIPDMEKGVLGIHITPTIDGNILLGPSAEFIDNEDDTSTSEEKMKLILNEAKEIIPSLTKKLIINSYSGVRCKLKSLENGGLEDFRIEESKNTSGLINLLGIESPGLTAAPAIAKEIINIIKNSLKLEKKNKFYPYNKEYIRFSEMSDINRSLIIKKNENFGRIICRCENVSEFEVIEALSNPLDAKVLSSVKYRCRAGLGRCQGGFCTQHIVRIMEKDFNIDINELKLKSPKSKLFVGRIREKKYDK